MVEIDLTQVIFPNLVLLDVSPFKSKDEMFEFMTVRFEKEGIVDCAKEYRTALEYRESLGSTYMGSHIALPHGKSSTVKIPAIGVCVCNEMFEYLSSGEKGMVKYIFMLAIPETQQGADYMRTLATLATLLAHKEFIDIIEKAKTYNDIIDGIKLYSL